MMFVCMDAFDDHGLRLLSKVKIPAHLQIHPEIRRVTKEFRQAQSTARGNPPPVNSRRVIVDGQTVEAAAAAFGLSRVTDSNPPP
jgi:hypothetical protein